MTPWMHEKEIQMIESYLEPNFIMLEFGSGGSTSHFSKYVKEYYSIEHNSEWCEKVGRSDLPPNVFRFLIHVDFLSADPYWDYINLIPQKIFDAVLIDGRERVRCGKKVLENIHEN